LIEATQLMVPVLGRACESGDVVDNMLGLVLGLTTGGIGVAVARLVTRHVPA
jgi:hypothetical protein